jgi:uncharacterized membrane-anchored protein
VVSDTIDQAEDLPTHNGSASSTRALNATPSYWLPMFAASALGTNLGDFTVETLGAGREISFIVLAIVAGVGIFADRRIANRSEFGFWLAIVTLRAAATNVGDFLTHDLAIGSIMLTALSAIMTLIAGHYTRVDTWSGSPRIDARYWLAMLIAGVFGTIGGDLLSHTVGLYAAATILCTATVLVILARQWVISRIAGTAAITYWCVVLVERAAGTPFGDALASHRAVGLGLPHAVVVTASLLLGALLIRRVFQTRASVGYRR